MTIQERDKKTQEKVKAIDVLCKQLDIKIIPKQALTKEGFMENVLYYADNEKYEIDAPKVPTPMKPGEQKPLETDPKELPPVEAYKNES